MWEGLWKCCMFNKTPVKGSHLDAGNNSTNKSLDSQCGSTVDLSGNNLH